MSEVKIAPIPDLGQRTDEITIYAGPCSVESAEQFEEVAECVADLGLHWIRGGAFKPRTNPHSFQGLGEEALKIMKAAVAAGADSLMIEVHPNPPVALSDGPQQLTPAQFRELIAELRELAACLGKKIV